MAPVTRVLVVDHDRLLRMSLRMVLEQEGYQVETVSTLAEALERLKRCRYDTVLTDLFLPDGGGMEVVGHARRLDPAAKVILMTDTEEALDPERALGAGVMEIILKPCELSVLVNSTRRAVEGPRTRADA